MVKIDGFCDNIKGYYYATAILDIFKPRLECNNKSCINCKFYMSFKQYRVMMDKLKDIVKR